MAELKIKIEAPEIAQAIEHLAEAISGKDIINRNAAPAKAAEISAPEANETTTAPYKKEAPKAEQQAAPQTAVPVSAPEYTLDQIARAGVSLVDAGKRNELTSLLAQRFGVQAITQIPPEQYGALAAELRALGALI